MFRKITSLILVVFVISLSGCVSAERRQARAEKRAAKKAIMGSNLQLGMTKDEVIKACGKPTQMGAAMQKNGKALESFIYIKTKTSAWTGISRARDFFIYFEDGKVVYYGGTPIVPSDY